MTTWFPTTRGARCRNPGEAVDPNAPVIAGLTVFGAAGGMAPHPVHVRANVEDGDGSHTGTDGGMLPEGQWQWHALKEDGTEIEIADRNLMKVTDPMTGLPVHTYIQKSASPCYSFTFPSPGTYVIRGRYRNRGDVNGNNKKYSAYVYTDPIVVTANTRTKRYVNGATGDDLWDGTSATYVSGVTGPKATFGAALALISNNNWEIEVADDTTCDLDTSVSVAAFSGHWFHRSGGGTLKPTIVNDAVGGVFRMGSNSVVDGFVIENDGFVNRPEIEGKSVCAVSSDASNVFLSNIEFHEVHEFFNSTGPKAVTIFNCRQHEVALEYVVYMSSAECMRLAGCNFKLGSREQAVWRITTGASPNYFTSFAASDFNDLSMNGATTKTVLRTYMKHFGAYRTRFAGGTISVGNVDARPADQYQYYDFCFDNCHFDFTHPTALMFFSIAEDTFRVVVRGSFIEQTVQNNAFSMVDRNSGGIAATENVRFRKNTWKTVTNTSGLYSRFIYNSATVPPVDYEHVDDLFIHQNSPDWDGKNESRFIFHPGGGSQLKNCALAPYVATKGNHFVTFGDWITYATVAAANAETFASDLFELDVSITADTAEPTGPDAALVATSGSSNRGCFDSFNGLPFTADTVGCFQPVA